MATPVPGNGNPEAAKVQDQIDQTVQQIEKQEVKVENASSPKEVKEEKAELNALIGRFDSLVARLDAIDQKLAEPTVPAPAPAATPTPEAVKEGETPVAATEGNGDEKPKKRRLGAWG